MCSWRPTYQLCSMSKNLIAYSPIGVIVISSHKHAYAYLPSSLLIWSPGRINLIKSMIKNYKFYESLLISTYYETDMENVIAAIRELRNDVKEIREDFKNEINKLREEVSDLKQAMSPKEKQWGAERKMLRERILETEESLER
ncbi:hypothetical protein FQR65_LT11087 [Abscondita terminalis]|nr:hypothetical protein FQR65_LT11087 [Abscondita terminalis]